MISLTRNKTTMVSYLLPSVLLVLQWVQCYCYASHLSFFEVLEWTRATPADLLLFSRNYSTNFGINPLPDLWCPDIFTESFNMKNSYFRRLEFKGKLHRGRAFSCCVCFFFVCLLVFTSPVVRLYFLCLFPYTAWLYQLKYQ